MEILFLTICGEKIVEIDHFRNICGSDLNATAQDLALRYAEENPGKEYRCGIYILAGERLAYAGEEVATIDD